MFNSASVEAFYQWKPKIMSAYFIFSHKVENSDQLNNEYLPKAIEVLNHYDPEILVVDQNIEVVEGQTPDTRTVILKFKDRATAKAWYDSPEYQDIIQLRLGATDGTAVLCDAFDPAGV